MEIRYTRLSLVDYIICMDFIEFFVCLADCQMDVSTHPISDHVTCLIKDTCTAVSCCMDIDFLQRSFETYITVDACNHWIQVGIEKLSLNISMEDLSFGTLSNTDLFLLSCEDLR